MDTIIQYITESYIDIAAVSIGLLYLYLEYKASIWMWAASIVMAVFFIYIFYTSQLYASMAIYIYFFGASIYGLAAWISSRDSETGAHIIRRISKKHILSVTILVAAAFVLLMPVLFRLTNNHIVITIGDSLATSLNIVALWMATRKWAEQWCLLIPANLVSAGLLLVQGEIASAIMFFVYFIVSIFGYLNWKKMAVRR